MASIGATAVRRLRAELESAREVAAAEPPLRPFPATPRPAVEPLPPGAPAREEDVVVTLSRGATGMVVLDAPPPAPAPAPSPAARAGAGAGGSDRPRFQHPARRVSGAARRTSDAVPAAAARAPAVLPFDPTRNATLQRLVADVEAATLAAAPHISRTHPTRQPVAPSHVRYLEALEDEVAALRIVARERHAAVSAKIRALKDPDWRPTHKVTLETFMQASPTPAGVLHAAGRHVYTASLAAGVIDPDGRGPTGSTRPVRPPAHPGAPSRGAPT
jgi:hypothetical protein